MGFSSIFSRPEWMICQVLAIPPPAIRPSVKHDAQQRSEDDLTHIIVNIIKANNTLQEKIESNANSNVVDDWHTVLQYYIATCVDNNLPGVASVPAIVPLPRILILRVHTSSPRGRDLAHP